jgi:dTMP kinase
LTLLLDVPVNVGLQRARERNAGAGLGSRDQDRFESQRVEFFGRVRAAYLARAAAEPKRMVVIDAGATADEVSAAITAALRARTWIS